MKQTFIIIMAAMFLTGCQAFIKERKAFNDAKASITIQAVCDMSLGAFFRLPDIDKTPIAILALNKCP